LLFVAARPVQGGPPLAVLRIPAPSFPYDFQLTDANRMMEGTEFKGAVLLSIRVDQDGDPLSKHRGDLGVMEQSYVGATELDLTLEPEDNPE
jgi:cytochrome c-type biogenesis protein CcmH